MVEKVVEDGFKESCLFHFSNFNSGERIRIYLEAINYNIEYKFSHLEEGVFFPIHVDNEFLEDHDGVYLATQLESEYLSLRYPKGTSIRVVKDLS